MDWIEPLLAKYGENRWCVIVDADELLVYPNSEKALLAEFCLKLERANVNALPCIMIDMYPNGNIENVTYCEGQSFIEASPFFDKTGYQFSPTATDVPKIIGGPRMRMFYADFIDTGFVARARRWAVNRSLRIPLVRKLSILQQLRLEPPILNKVPLVKWDKNMIFHAAAHFITGARVASARGALLHFKFLGDFKKRTNEEMVRSAYFMGGAEYKRYSDVIRRHAYIDFSCALSTRYRGTGQLLDLGLIQEI